MANFPSKLYWSKDSQAQECVNLARQISDVEKRERHSMKREGHSMTFLVGDLNMNPFEQGMIGSVGLNATMARSIASQKYRTVQERRYPFFYNPMWNLLGDDHPPAGTYYYPSNEHDAYFWHMFDQVLVRPDLMNRLPIEGVEIVTGGVGVDLLNKKGFPDKKGWSDHLPILFRSNLEADDINERSD